VFSPLSLAGIFVVSACAALIFFTARSWIGEATGLGVLTFAFWAPMLFGLLVITVFNFFFFKPAMGVSLYNYSLGLLPAPALLVALALGGVILRAFKVWYILDKTSPIYTDRSNDDGSPFH
jgi:hypothetical protein